MKTTLVDTQSVISFVVLYDGRAYNVKVYTSSESSKFIDWEVTAMDGEEIDEGVEDAIISKIDEDWDKF
jgi:hypothetical protein